MRKIILGFAVLALLFHGFPPSVQAKTGYVSDMLILTFREGPSKSFPVTKSLPSDTPLIVMGEQDGYLHVQLSSGETGWVEKQYVVYDPPKSTVIEQLTKQNQALEKEIEALQATHEEYKNQITQQSEASEGQTSAMAAELKELQEKNKTLEQDLAAAREKYNTLVEQSGDIHQIVKQNEILTKENKKLANDIAALEDQTSHQFKTGMIKWFLAGVGVLLLGWLLGHSVSSKKRRRGSLLD